MATVVTNTVKYDHTIDQKTMRHRINGIPSVLHCHHYSSLYTQLALDAGETELLKDCARDSFRTVLSRYFAENPDIDTIEKKIDIGSQYFALLGLGTMKVLFLGRYSGEVEVPSSHVDEGWKKKWGEYDKPINYITAGFIEALFEVVQERPPRTFLAIEKESIAMGAEKSVFAVTRR